MNRPAADLTALVIELRQQPPFAQMALADVERFAAEARPLQRQAGSQLAAPADGPVRQLWLLRRGVVGGRSGLDRQAAGAYDFQIEAGELFPLAALMAGRAVSSSYEALEDCELLEIDADSVHALAARSAVWADHLHRQLAQLLAWSNRALQAVQAARALDEQSLEAPLASLARKAPVACDADTPLHEALTLMHERGVGSVLVLDADGRAVGILTRHDVLERVALRRPPPGTALRELMSAPVHCLDIAASAQDAVLLMSRHGIRHVPLTEHGRVVSLVSERDLFALQRRSLRQVGSAIRSAADSAALVAAAAEIRQFARQLMAQGLSARALTQLISHLNDLLAQRLVTLVAAAHGLDLRRACWLALGSEGRDEQTISTDQDNGLVFESANPDADRPAWLAMAREVNQTLDDCGYPLCRGNVMASNPLCCLTTDEWIARFDHWMERGTPEDMLNASIYFDFRPLVGQLALAAPMRAFVTRRAAELPRFMKQMADNALSNRPALNWRGALDTVAEGGGHWIDLKLRGAMIFVDSARLYALAQGVDQTSTRGRFLAVAAGLHASDTEAAGWVNAFEVVQMLRLRVQVVEGGPVGNPNRIDVDRLDTIDQRLLREAMRVARSLQQRLALDYQR
ncbi:MAG: DUF294 nucleotidyltransferase-like domain-containing protein [Rubrivivax sp.]|nr:DUF294 nucleotidyltransferase-like domain-containing protein [Rubrivivax sp.]